MFPILSFPHQFTALILEQPMNVIGVRLQSGGGLDSMFSAQFNLQYESSTDVFTSQTQVHTLTHNDLTDVMLTTPEFNRKFRLQFTRWNGMTRINTALLVSMCTLCIDKSVSVGGSVSASACQCQANTYYDDSAWAQRAIALMPGTTVLTSLARRYDYDQEASAIFEKTLGPPNARGAVVFEAKEKQYLNGG